MATFLAKRVARCVVLAFATLVLSVCVLVTPVYANVTPRSEFRGTSASGAIVFVHGLQGNGRATFTSVGGDKRVYWLDLIKGDKEPFANGATLSNYDLYTIEYDAGHDSPFTLPQIIGNLVNDISESARLHQYRHVVFVAHSFGGIVIQAVLVRLAAKNAPIVSRTSGVLLLGSPAKGSPLASLCRRISSIRICDDLASESSVLGLTEDDWRRSLQGRIVTYCAFGLNDNIVPKDKLHSACKELQALAGDHSSIVKPTGVEHKTYQWFRSRIEKLEASLKPDRDEEDWKAAKARNTIDGFRAYLSDHPQGRFLLEAQERIGNLEKERDLEEARKVEEARKQEKQRKAEEVRLEQQRRAEEGRRAEEARKAEERRRIEEARKGEEDWKVATEFNTIEAYRNYVDKHPNGKFVTAANLKIKALGQLAGKCDVADVARSRTVTVADRETLLLVHSDWDQNCNAKDRPDISILAKPKQGSISLRPAVETVEQEDCRGHKVAGTGLFYTPNQNHGGSDIVVYRRLWANKAAHCWTIRINVR